MQSIFSVDWLITSVTSELERIVLIRSVSISFLKYGTKGFGKNILLLKIIILFFNLIYKEISKMFS